MQENKKALLCVCTHKLISTIKYHKLKIRDAEKISPTVLTAHRQCIAEFFTPKQQPVLWVLFKFCC